MKTINIPDKLKTELDVIKLRIMQDTKKNLSYSEIVRIAVREVYSQYYDSDAKTITITESVKGHV